MSSKMMNDNASLKAEMATLVQERIRTRKYLDDLEKLYDSEAQKAEVRAEWTKEAQDLALCKKKLKKVHERRESVHNTIGGFLKPTDNGLELLSPSDENINMYGRLSEQLGMEVDKLNDSKQASSADRVKKVEECIALIAELKTYRKQLINQKGALQLIRQNEKIEETILELAIAVQTLKLKVKLVESALNKDQTE